MVTRSAQSQRNFRNGNDKSTMDANNDANQTTSYPASGCWSPLGRKVFTTAVPPLLYYVEQRTAMGSMNVHTAEIVSASERMKQNFSLFLDFLQVSRNFNSECRFSVTQTRKIRRNPIREVLVGMIWKRSRHKNS